MLRVIQNRDSRTAKGYYSSKAEAGYYAGAEQEMVGSWGGLAAERLGLAGEVDQPSFDRLIDNRHPETGERLTARTRKDRTPGYDFNFHACKSASILYALTGDPAILRAFREAVAGTMREIEREIQTRVRSRGRCEDRTVGNMAWAEFLHFTARPVGGVIDPHLHAHCFVFNAVFDPVEHKWKAGQFRDLKANAPRFEQAFHDRFARNLAALGYPLAHHGRRWEIAGIDRATIDKFSGRTRQIEQYAQEHGITDPREKDQLGARTRSRKRSSTGMNELRRQWQARLTGREQAAVEAACSRRGFIAAPTPEGAKPPSPAREPHSLQQRQRRMHQARLAPPGMPPAGPPDRHERHA